MGVGSEVLLSLVSVDVCTQKISLRRSWQSLLGKRSRQGRETFALGSDVREAFVGSAFAAFEATERGSWEDWYHHWEAKRVR